MKEIACCPYTNTVIANKLFARMFVEIFVLQTIEKGTSFISSKKNSNERKQARSRVDIKAEIILLRRIPCSLK